MHKFMVGLSLPVVFMALSGCGDGTLEFKNKSNGGGDKVIIKEKEIVKEPVIVDRPVIIEKQSPTRETIRTETTTPRGNTTTTTDTKVTR